MSLHLPDILCDLFREVCRHLDLQEAAPDLLAALRRWLPVAGLRLDRWEPERGLLWTAARAGAAPGAIRQGLPTPKVAALTGWAARQEAVCWLGRAEDSLARLLLPEDFFAAAAAIPLLEGGRLVGVVVLASGRSVPGGEAGLHAYREILTALTGPFTAALANDRRIHEMARLREAAEQDRQVLLNRLERQEVGDIIVGAERGLQPVLQRLSQVAPTDAPVLILGETGAGKEVLARALHRQSRRRQNAFLRINCGAIPPELIDSELFGHEKGSFTGAIAQRKGWFERADGGTLFLDEIAELPAAAQVRLLRILQDGSFQRVGGQQSHTADVRIVAATHRNIAGMVQDGRFRQDLWYRISVFPLHLPPLRERPGDIAELSDHFSVRAGRRLFGRPLHPTPADVARLAAWRWPGNVRELAAVIERAAILGGGHTLDVATALGDGALPGQPQTGILSAPLPASATNSDSTIDAIIDGLRRCRGRIEGPFGVAAQLGVNPHTLRARMRRIGIDWSRYRSSSA